MRNLFGTKRRIAIVGATVALALAGGGTAFAYFTSTGSGTGSASVGAAADWTVTAVSDVSHGIFPGAGSGTITYTVTNPGSGSQSFSTAVPVVVADGSGNVEEQGTPVPGCLASWFNVTANPPTPAFGTSIDPAGTATVTVTVTLTNEPVNQNACENITGPDVTLTVS